MDLRVETRFKNNVLYQALERQFRGMIRHGDGGIIGVAAECIGVTRSLLSDLLLLKRSPYIYGGKVSPGAAKIADALGEPVDVLFPVTLYKLNFPRVHVRELDSAQVLSLQSLSMEDRLLPPPDVDISAERREELDKALATLSPRHEKWLRWRFGLADEKPDGASLDEICNEFGVTRERARQIGERALRMMRNHERSNKLRRFVK